MEVKLDKRYPVRASVEQAWAVLSDVRAVAACMPGAAITEQIDPTHYKGTVKSKVGPATMSFGGDIEVLGLNADERTLAMLGKGADKSGSSASMKLEARVEAGATATESVLVGLATILVSGKLAQFGSRLLVPVSDAMLAQFAERFNAAAAAVPALVDTVAAAPLAEGPPAAGSIEAPVPPMAALPAATVSVPPPPAPANELNALGLLWTVVKGWFAQLFGRR